MLQKVRIADALNRRQQGNIEFFCSATWHATPWKSTSNSLASTVAEIIRGVTILSVIPTGHTHAFFLFRFLAYYSAIMLCIRVNCASPSGGINRVSQKIGRRLLPKLIFLLRCLWHGAPQSKATVQSCEPDLNSLAWTVREINYRGFENLP